MMKILIVCLLAGLTAALVPLTRHREHVPGSYIIQLKENEDPSALLDFINKAGGLNRKSKVKVTHRYKNVVNGFSVNLPISLLTAIRDFDMVESVEEDGVVELDASVPWDLDRIDQRNLPLDDRYEPSGFGEGVNIYVIDTGINRGHRDFQGRNLEVHSVLGTDGNDRHGHGTHCAGTAAGNTFGVAKEANIISIQCMIGRTGTTSDLVAALEWVTANGQKPAVVSLSIGIPGSVSKYLDQAVEAVSTKSGILVVNSAGNENVDACKRSPSRVASAMVVGATDKNDKRAWFSNFGDCVDIMGPGVHIVSAGIGGPTAEERKSGTSMAAPHVAGVAAILLACNPNQTPKELKDNILNKATAGLVMESKGTPNLLVYVGKGSA